MSSARGNENEKVLPSPGVLVTPHVTPVELDQTFGKREPQPRAPRAALNALVSLPARKGSKSPAKSSSAMPTPVSVTAKVTASASASTKSVTRPPGGVKGDGVGEQVEEHLLELERIGEKKGGRLG